MLPKISILKPLDGYRLFVGFDDGREVVYDVGDDINHIDEFSPLVTMAGLFNSVRLDKSRTVVFWNEEIDLPSDTIYEYGESDTSCIHHPTTKGDMPIVKPI